MGNRMRCVGRAAPAAWWIYIHCSPRSSARAVRSPLTSTLPGTSSAWRNDRMVRPVLCCGAESPAHRHQHRPQDLRYGFLSYNIPGYRQTYTASTSGWDAATASRVAPAGTTNAQVLLVVSSLGTTMYVDAFVLKR